MTAPGWGDDRSRPPSPSPAPEGAPPDEDGELSPIDEGPPSVGIFSLEGRRAPGLYLAAWLLIVSGLLLAFLIGPMASSETAGLALVIFGVVLATLGFAAASGAQVMERQDRHPQRYRGPSPLLTFLTYLFAVSLIGFGAVALGYDGTEDALAFAVIGGIQLVSYVAVVWIFAVRTGALSWPDMGWPTWNGSGPTQVVGAIAWSAFLMIPITFGVLLLGGLIGTLLDAEAPSVLPPMESSLDVALVLIGAALLAPIGEEVLFRGMALTAWRRDLGDRAALIRSSVFFAAVHLLNIPATDAAGGISQAVLTVAVLLPVGFALGWMFLRRGLVGAISAHATYNFILLILLLAAGDVA